MRIPSGTTDRYVYFVAVATTDFTTRQTGLSSFTVHRSRNGAAAALYTTPTINETSATGLPGVYELLLDEDTTLAAGNDTEEYVVHITAATMAPVTRVVELYRPETTEGNTLGVAADGDVSGNIDGAVASVTGNVGGSVAGDLQGDVLGDAGATVAVTSLGAGVITSTSIASNAITSAKIATDAIGAAQIAANAITTSEFADGTITAAKIATDAITAAKIAANAITTSELADGTITAAKIATDAITATKIASNAITSAKIATDAIGAAQIAANAIGASELASNCIGSDQLATTAIDEIGVEVNAEVSDVMKTDTISEPSQQAPPAGPTFEEAIIYLYTALRNKIDVTATMKEFHNDAGTVIWKKALSDDGTTYSEAEGVTGP